MKWFRDVWRRAAIEFAPWAPTFQTLTSNGCFCLDEIVAAAALLGTRFVTTLRRRLT